MYKFHLLTGCLLSLITVAKVLSFSSTSVIAHRTSTSSQPPDPGPGGRAVSRLTPEVINSDISPSLALGSEASWSMVLDTVFTPRGEPKDNGSGRRGVARIRPQFMRSWDSDPATLCLLTPNRIEDPDKEPETTKEPEITKVWNTRPLFVWQGTVRNIVVVIPMDPHFLRQATSVETEPFGLNYAHYEGEPLQSGQTYRVSFLSPKTQKYVAGFLFQVMDASQREPITRALKNLENQLRESHASEESIALHRAQYFAERQMLADMLQEMYLVENPSEDLKEAIQEIESETCSPDAS